MGRLEEWIGEGNEGDSDDIVQGRERDRGWGGAEVEGWKLEVGGWRLEVAGCRLRPNK